MTIAATTPPTSTPPDTDGTHKVRHPLVTRRLAVTAVEQLSRSMRRVRLAGPDLAGLVALGPTDHVKVFFPDDTGHLRLPTLVDGRWADRTDPGLVFRDYTVRTFDGSTLTLDMVVHGHGPAGRWAAQAQPGDELGLLGPRGSALRPLDRPWYLLAVDDTGLPAAANWLDRIPDGTPVHVLAEVDGPADELALSHPALAATWLHRDGAEPGTTDLLASAAAEHLARLAPTGNGLVFGAGEVSAMRAVREHVRDHGLTHAVVTSYWRRGVANFDHHSPDA